MAGDHRHRFETTRWSLVAAVGGSDSAAAREALAGLCETYWYPLYAYARRAGHDADDARELTQSFFAHLLERHDLEHVRQERGRLRSYLLAALRHFLLNDAVHRRALKRGGGVEPISLELELAEDRYAHEPADTRTPETLFERRWALTVFEGVFHQLRREWEAAGKSEQFDHLKESLADPVPHGGYGPIASTLGLSENATRTAVFRLRRQFQRRLRDVIAETVASDDAVEDEIQHLFAALRR